MAVTVLALLAVAAGLFWWLRHRAARLQDEAEQREAKMLQALFAARQSGAGNGGETVDVDEIFEDRERLRGQSATDAALRAAGLEADVIALVRSSPAHAAAPLGADKPAAPEPTRERRSGARVATAVEESDEPAPTPGIGLDAEAPIPVRDLVQTFYEARGYHVLPVASSAHPIELVLRHKTDPLRAYAFAPLQDPVSEAVARAMLERAQRIEQPRVLIATESDTDHALAQALQARGVRVYDRRMIESQLRRVDPATVAKLRAAARRRAARRQSAPG